MSWLRARILPIIGILCLAGQGILLYLAGTGPDAPAMPWPQFFVILSLLQVMVVFLDRHRADAISPEYLRSLVIGLTLAGSLALLVVGWLFAFPGSDAKAVAARPSADLTVGRQALEDLVPALLAFNGGVIAGDMEPDAPTASLAVDGRFFRYLADLPALWAAGFAQAPMLPLEAVMWRDGERVGWTAGAMPLGLREIGSAGLLVLQDRGGRTYLRHLRPFGPGMVLEFQVALGPDDGLGLLPGVSLTLRAGEPSGALLDQAGNPVSEFLLAANLPGQPIRLTLEPEETGSRLHSHRARALLVGMLVWTGVLAGFSRLFLGATLWLVALWGGRAMLASSEFLTWVSAAFPGKGFPAGPRSPFSLIDPAYFATPFASGWFASVADALLTVLLVALTALSLARWSKAVSQTNLWFSMQARWAGGPLGGLVFGLLSGGVLLWLRFFAGLLAENANARLVGTGASFSYLSFWGLQLVLMGMTFSLCVLVVRWVGSTAWPQRGSWPRWVAGVVLAATGSLLITLLDSSLWWGGRMIAGAVAVGLWLVAPALGSRPRFLRRIAWPLVLILGVVWNYASLREVYDVAERSWLHRKGGLITQADEEWTRYLLGSVLEEMEAADGATFEEPAPDTDIWRDRPAWALWNDSALRDLGYACLVEVVGPDGEEESLFARGFLRNFQYEVVGRSAWVDNEGNPPGDQWEMIFQTERRTYAGGEEEIVAAEIERSAGRGWIRIELPVRSWRISTLMADLGANPDNRSNGYRPRAEVDRPVLLMLADNSGWLATGQVGRPGPAAERQLGALRSAEREWAVMPLAGGSWLCRWNPLPDAAARTPGEGFLLGLRRAGFGAVLLDLSRLMLLHLTLYFIIFGLGQIWRQVIYGGMAEGSFLVWRPGFQERFLAGYLFLGLVLLLVVGMSVDRVGNDRIREEARIQTREGLNLAVENLRSLLVEQARSLAGSEYIADLLFGQMAGNRPLGPVEMRQGMVFAADGTLLLDETLSDLDDQEAAALLAAGRRAPLVIVRDDQDLYVGAVIPLDLSGYLAEIATPEEGDPGHGETATSGFFFYRQRFDADLLGGLAELARGQAQIRLGGMPQLASHPGAIFAGEAPLLAAPSLMGPLLELPGEISIFASPGRPFAFSGAQPVPAFMRDGGGRLVQSSVPAVLTLAFPDREREFESQRRGTILFLAGLANLILLTALFLALLMSWNIFRPLRVLLDATRSLAQGDFAAPLPEAGKDEVGRLAGAFGLMRGELQSARDDLAARERFLTTLLNRVTVGVAVLDRDRNIVVLNPAGDGILQAFGPWDDDQQGVLWLLEGFRDLGSGQDRLAGELKSPDGRRSLRGAMAPLELPDGRRDTMLVFEDITEFLENQKMAINADLARQVAHEIKNPLTPIQLSVQLLSQAWRDQHPRLDSIVTETVDRVLDQVTLLRSIASEFSLLGRPGELEVAPLDLAVMVADIVAGYGAGQAGSSAEGFVVPGVTIEVAEMPLVLAHRESLQKILGNLMQNSLDAARGEEPVSIAISWRVGVENVTMVWGDNGTGLPAEVADRLFDPYFSTKSKGTGLGLVICRNLADRMGGTIALSNRSDGPGAIAELTLPRSGTGNPTTKDR